MILNFIALHRQSGISAGVVAGDIVVLQTEQIERQTKGDILETVVAQTARFEPLRLNEIGGFLDAGGRRPIEYKTR